MCAISEMLIYNSNPMNRQLSAKLAKLLHHNTWSVIIRAMLMHLLNRSFNCRIANRIRLTGFRMQLLRIIIHNLWLLCRWSEAQELWIANNNMNSIIPKFLGKCTQMWYEHLYAKIIFYHVILVPRHKTHKKIKIICLIQ